jgi:6,7-dimethyl-8-ribityllumazine synthase
MKIKSHRQADRLPDGRGLRFGVLVSEFNSEITNGLLSSCVRALKERGVREADIHIAYVPGAFELPLAAQAFVRRRRYDGLIALGCVLRGKTPHDAYISQETARGLGQVALDTGVPVAFGVLTSLTPAQARERSRPGPLDKGREAAHAVLKMAELMKCLGGRK